MKQKVISTMLLLSMGQHSLQDVEQQQETEQKVELLMQQRKGYQYLFMERRVSNKS